MPLLEVPAATSPANLAATALPDDLAEKSEQVDAIFAAFVPEDAPGGAVIVVQAGHILHQAGYGLADLENGRPITPQTLFHLGSAGKQFTGL
ncbi:MAG: serine hydrolase, partial [Chloroflexi bacterium]|nr:serine hydrolase [Chloroflexota bacterium]